MISTKKAECSTEPFTLDWTDFYARHNIDSSLKLITSSTWTVTDGTKGAEYIATPQTTLTIIGGTPGVTLVAENTIEINGGEFRDCRKLYIEVF